MLFVLGVSSTRRQVQIASRMGIKTAGAQGEKGDPEIRLTVFIDFLGGTIFFSAGMMSFPTVSLRKFGHQLFLCQGFGWQVEGHLGT